MNEWNGGLDPHGEERAEPCEACGSDRGCGEWCGVKIPPGGQWKTSADWSTQPAEVRPDFERMRRLIRRSQ